MPRIGVFESGLGNLTIIVGRKRDGHRSRSRTWARIRARRRTR
jgi:hypothetical protein